MPPLLLVRVPMVPFFAMKTSFCSLPRWLTPANPRPYSNPFTALMPNMAPPNAAWSLLKAGSPNPMGQWRITPVMIPPIVSPFALTSEMRLSMAAAFSVSGQRTSFVSICAGS